MYDNILYIVIKVVILFRTLQIVILGMKFWLDSLNDFRIMILNAWWQIYCLLEMYKSNSINTARFMFGLITLSWTRVKWVNSIYSRVILRRTITTNGIHQHVYAIQVRNYQNIKRTIVETIFLNYNFIK